MEISLSKKLLEVIPKEYVLTSKEELACYSYDSGIYALFKQVYPDAVVLVQSVNDVVKTMAVAREAKVPVIPRGAGTGQSGGAIAQKGGICLDLSHWKEVKIFEEDFQVFARPGVTLEQLNRALAPYQLYLPPDPSSSSACTLGGMVANNTAGQRSIKYGVTASYVLGLEVVLSTGEVVTLGGQNARTLKSVSGLDLSNGLFIGSEGILGVITGIRLKVVPIPLARAGILFMSSDKADVPRIIRQIYKANVVLSACEFVLVQPSAHNQVRESLSEIPLPPSLEMVLLLEFEGNPASVEWEMKVSEEILAKYAGCHVCAQNADEMNHLWHLLDEAEGGVTGSRPGSKRIPGGEDIVVPPSRLIEALDSIQRLVQDAGVSCVNFGHAAVGNIHTGLLINLSNQQESGKLSKLVTDIHNLAIELNGATTGEHGTGLVRQSLLEREHGSAVAVMERIKATLDPDGILNPGKILK